MNPLRGSPPFPNFHDFHVKSRSNTWSVREQNERKRRIPIKSNIGVFLSRSRCTKSRRSAQLHYRLRRSRVCVRARNSLAILSTALIRLTFSLITPLHCTKIRFVGRANGWMRYTEWNSANTCVQIDLDCANNAFFSLEWTRSGQWWLMDLRVQVKHKCGHIKYQQINLYAAHTFLSHFSPAEFSLMIYAISIWWCSPCKGMRYPHTHDVSYQQKVENAVSLQNICLQKRFGFTKKKINLL